MLDYHYIIVTGSKWRIQDFLGAKPQGGATVDYLPWIRQYRVFNQAALSAGSWLSIHMLCASSERQEHLWLSIHALSNNAMLTQSAKPIHTIFPN